MDRLRCGTIYTDSFAYFLRDWWLSSPKEHEQSIPSIEYIYCKEGPRKGEHWMTIAWVFREGKNALTIFSIDGVPLHLSVRAQKALKTKCLDTMAGKVVVRG
jgi:hypothetical protein